jgi:hypothetical protein
MIKSTEYTIGIENAKGSYKSFDVAGYPLAGVTYPVDYGYIQGYEGEDGSALDVFVGTGDLAGYIVVWRLDVPVETKVFMNLTKDEFAAVKKAFDPVLVEDEVLDDQSFVNLLKRYVSKV